MKAAIVSRNPKENRELSPVVEGGRCNWVVSTKDVRAIGVAIAILGQNGLDINDPVQKYTLRSLPGTYSGLHLCSIMYAAFKQFEPHEDVGIDFSKEYDAAFEMRGQ